MKFFLKMQVELVQNFVEYGWGPLLKLDEIGKSTEELEAQI